MTTINSTAALSFTENATANAPFWRRLLDRVLESRRRKADMVIIEHLRHHRPDSEFRVEFERRLLGQ